MTKKEFYTTIAAMDTAELATFASDELRKMDEAAAKRREKPSKAAIENAALAERIVEYLRTSGEVSLATVAAEFEVSGAKVTAAIKPEVESGHIVKGKGRNGKSTYVTLHYVA